MGREGGYLDWKLAAGILSIITFIGGLVASTWALDDRIRAVVRMELVPMKEDVAEIKSDVRVIRDTLLFRDYKAEE